VRGGRRNEADPVVVVVLVELVEVVFVLDDLVVVVVAPPVPGRHFCFGARVRFWFSTS
jgi:hypothetical protein